MLGKLIDLRVAAGGPGVGHPEVTTLSDELTSMVTLLPRVIGGVDGGEAPEGHVIWAGRVLGGAVRPALIVGVVSYQVTSVHVGRNLKLRCLINCPQERFSIVCFSPQRECP